MAHFEYKKIDYSPSSEFCSVRMSTATWSTTTATFKPFPTRPTTTVHVTDEAKLAIFPQRAFAPQSAVGNRWFARPFEVTEAPTYKHSQSKGKDCKSFFSAVQKTNHF